MRKSRTFRLCPHLLGSFFYVGRVFRRRWVDALISFTSLHPPMFFFLLSPTSRFRVCLFCCCCCCFFFLRLLSRTCVPCRSLWTLLVRSGPSISKSRTLKIAFTVGWSCAGCAVLLNHFGEKTREYRPTGAREALPYLIGGDEVADN